MERGSLQYGPPSGPLAEYQLEHVVSRIDAGHVNQAFAATVLFLFLPRDIVSIELNCASLLSEVSRIRISSSSEATYPARL